MTSLISLAGCNHSSPNPATATLGKEAREKARIAAQGRESERQQLEQVPAPTKSQYIDVHSTDTWQNPFLSVGVDTVKMRVIMPDANPSSMGQGGMLRPASARRQDLQVRISDLPKALIALPVKAWPYGRVIAVAEEPTMDKKQRPQIRRNVEATIQLLNDLGIVVNEWPAR